MVTLISYPRKATQDELNPITLLVRAIDPRCKVTSCQIIGPAELATEVNLSVREKIKEMVEMILA
jgi:hypothetical protein